MSQYSMQKARLQKNCGFLGGFLNVNHLDDATSLCHKVLRGQEAQNVNKEMFGSEKLKQLSEDMIAIMRKAPGVGLAAPQIGVGLKVLAHQRI